VSFAAITLYVTSQRMFIVVSVYFVIDSVRKLLDTPSYLKGKENQLRENGGRFIQLISDTFGLKLKATDEEVCLSHKVSHLLEAYTSLSTATQRV